MAGAIPTEVQDAITAAQGRDGWQAPGAWAVGLARFAGQADEHGAVPTDATVLDVWYPTVNCAVNNGAAAIVAETVGHTAGSATYRLDAAAIERVQSTFEPLWAERHSHPNLRALAAVGEAARTQLERPLAPHAVVVTFIEDLAVAPVSAADVYLRLQLLSHRAIQPHGANLDGAFGLLTNVAWTNHGPFAADFVECARGMLRLRGQQLTVTSVDKFPRMTDYVVPDGVRIADADRVRLGAHLATGTTIMHEGFVNFNAGTLGASMVEGRISAGVVVGDGSDVGGGASIMGTLSGGGQEVIRVGEGCLLGANAGLGISLGDRCTIEAGTYVTAGAKVTYHGTVVKAGSLSGKNDLLFRRHSQTGALEVIEQANTVALNEALHAN